MKYTEVIKLPLNTPLVLDIGASPAGSVSTVNRKHVKYGVLVDYKNYREQSWTGSNGDGWAFDPTHRGFPPVETDTASRAKRHLVALIDLETGNQTGQHVLLMPKNILGLYSEVKTEWELLAQAEELLAKEQSRRNELEAEAKAHANILIAGAETSIRKTTTDILGRAPKYDDLGVSLSPEVVFNETYTTCRGKIGGNVRMSYDLYLRFMEYVYAGMDAQ